MKMRPFSKLAAGDEVSGAHGTARKSVLDEASTSMTLQHQKPNGFELDCRRQPEGRDKRERASQLTSAVEFQKRSIIVTGGAGFIGSHVTRALVTQGHAVTVLDDFNDFYNPTIKRANLADLQQEVEIVECDLRDEEATHRLFKRVQPEITLHLAARAGVRPSILNPKLYIDTNINGTFHALEGARQAGCERFIFASSSSVYGLNKTIPFCEDAPILQTLSPYAATKLAGEQLCGNYSYLYGMRSVALRFFTVYGPGQRPDLAIHRFTDAIAHGRPIQQFGDGSTRRDYTYIEDIVQGVLGAIKYEGPLFDIFNLGESETTTLATLIATLEKIVDRKAVIEHLPEQKGDMPLTYADITKAKKLLGYNPQTPLITGLKKFVEWYQEGYSGRA